MKKPPDVIVMDTPKPSIEHWIDLLIWAVKNNEPYLIYRAKQQLLK